MSENYKSVVMFNGDITVDAYISLLESYVIVESRSHNGYIAHQYFSLEMLTGMETASGNVLDDAILLHSKTPVFRNLLYIAKVEKNDGGSSTSDNHAVHSHENKAFKKPFTLNPFVSELAKIFKNIYTTVDHPVNGTKSSLSSTVMDLNDGYGWSRNRIADWIESLDIDTTLVEGESNGNRNTEQARS